MELRVKLMCCMVLLYATYDHTVMLNLACMSAEGQSDSIVGDIENMVRSYIEKVIIFIPVYAGL
jgi:hypothetical protein